MFNSKCFEFNMLFCKSKLDHSSHNLPKNILWLTFWIASRLDPYNSLVKRILDITHWFNPAIDRRLIVLRFGLFTDAMISVSVSLKTLHHPVTEVNCSGPGPGQKLHKKKSQTLWKIPIGTTDRPRETQRSRKSDLLCSHLYWSQTLPAPRDHLPAWRCCPDWLDERLRNALAMVQTGSREVLRPWAFWLRAPDLPIASYVAVSLSYLLAVPSLCTRFGRGSEGTALSPIAASHTFCKDSVRYSLQLTLLRFRP